SPRSGPPPRACGRAPASRRTRGLRSGSAGTAGPPSPTGGGAVPPPAARSAGEGGRPGRAPAARPDSDLVVEAHRVGGGVPVEEGDAFGSGVPQPPPGLAQPALGVAARGKQLLGQLRAVQHRPVGRLVPPTPRHVRSPIRVR